MLDDANVRSQRDPKDMLSVVAAEYEQLTADTEVVRPNEAGFVPKNVVVAALGGSALAAEMARDWLQLPVPLEIISGYEVPSYVSENTLVIAVSYSGGTEETLSAVANAEMKGAHIAVVSSGGRLLEIAVKKHYPSVVVPQMQPRMGVLYNLRAIVRLLESFGLADRAGEEMAANADWLQTETAVWRPNVPMENNYAKQLAIKAVGKTTVIYGGVLSAAAHKWKVAVNENAKNLAFYNILPEFCHNEFTGWTSHPIDKPFHVIDLVSDFDHPQVKKRFQLTDQLLSGRWPAATTVIVKGDNLIAQLMWVSVLSDYVSVYLAILNNVDPTALDAVDKMKKALAADKSE